MHAMCLAGFHSHVHMMYAWCLKRIMPSGHPSSSMCAGGWEVSPSVRPLSCQSNMRASHCESLHGVLPAAGLLVGCAVAAGHQRLPGGAGRLGQGRIH